MEMLKNYKSAQTKAQYYRIPKTTSERSEWFHKNKFDIMMAWLTPVSLHFSDVPTGSNNLYRQTTLGYWFSTFASNSFSRRTVVQINLWTQWMSPQKKQCSIRRRSTFQTSFQPAPQDTCTRCKSIIVTRLLLKKIKKQPHLTFLQCRQSTIACRWHERTLA